MRAKRLRDYEVRPRCLRIGETVAKGYLLDEFQQAFKWYISESEVQALRAECTVVEPAVAAGGGRAKDGLGD